MKIALTTNISLLPARQCLYYDGHFVDWHSL